jgi:hypothetical protein
VQFERRRDGRYNGRLITPQADTINVEAVDAPDTSAAARRQYAGTYYSAEADARFVVTDSAGALRMSREWPQASAVLRPSYKDGYVSPVGNLLFTRGRNGAITGFTLTFSRVRNLRFVKQ